MKKREENINVRFDIYDLDGNFIESIDDLGSADIWLGGPNSPIMMAILPVLLKDVKESDFKYDLLKIVRTRYDKDFKDIPGSQEEIIMVTDYSKKDSIELAKKYDCDHLYFIEWDAERYLTYIDLENDEEEVYNMME